MIVETQYLDLSQPLPLDCGRELRGVRIAYESYGALNDRRDNVVLVCHALSGDAHAAGITPGVPSAGEVEGRDVGWWDSMIGPGRAFDTDRWHVICTNLLGGCRGTTGPSSTDPAAGRPYGSSFPTLTVADLVRAQRAFLAELGIESLVCVTGASLGGMQALEFAVDYPELVRGVVAIASTARLDAQGVALNSVARNAITSDPDFAGGDYYDTGRTPDSGLALARQIGHITYLSKHSLRAKFPDDRFAVEGYLAYQGEKFVRRFDANTYLLLSRALTRFDLPLSRLADARARFLLLSFTSDWIYPPACSDELAEALSAAGREVEHVTLETTYGHDSFLLEDELQAPHIRRFLDRVGEGSA